MSRFGGVLPLMAWFDGKRSGAHAGRGAATVNKVKAAIEAAS